MVDITKKKNMIMFSITIPAIQRYQNNEVSKTQRITTDSILLFGNHYYTSDIDFSLAQASGECFLPLFSKVRSWDGSMGKRTSCSYRGPGFGSRGTQSSQPPVAPVPRGLIPSSGFCRHCMPMVLRQMQTKHSNTFFKKSLKSENLTGSIRNSGLL